MINIKFLLPIFSVARNFLILSHAIETSYILYTKSGHVSDLLWYFNSLSFDFSFLRNFDRLFESWP